MRSIPRLHRQFSQLSEWSFQNPCKYSGTIVAGSLIGPFCVCKEAALETTTRFALGEGLKTEKMPERRTFPMGRVDRYPVISSRVSIHEIIDPMLPWILPRDKGRPCRSGKGRHRALQFAPGALFHHSLEGGKAAFLDPWTNQIERCPVQTDHNDSKLIRGHPYLPT